MPTFTCPMHPEIHTDRQSNCPKCGMKLELQEEGTTRTSSRGKPAPTRER